MARITWDNSPAMEAAERSWVQEMFNKNTMPGWVGAAQIGADLWTMSEQKKQASAVRKFQRQMSNTAHVRQVRDMRAAGLNPILSAGGSGATTPGGAQAQLQGIRNPLTAGIQAAQGMASAKLTGENAKVASLEAKHKTAFYKMLERGPGGPEIAAFNAMFPGNKVGQGAALVNLGVGKAATEAASVNSGKLTSKFGKALRKQLFFGMDPLEKSPQKRYEKGPSGYGSSKGGPKPKLHSKEQYKDFVVPYK